MWFCQSIERCVCPGKDSIHISINTRIKFDTAEVWSRIDATRGSERYLTVSRRRRGDYKLIFKLIYEYELVITKPEATNIFSISLQVNIM